MNQPSPQLYSPTKNPGVLCRPPLTALAAALIAGWFVAGAAQAIEFGPEGMLTLTGFAEFTATGVNNQCKGCQYDKDTDRQRIWTDDVVPGKKITTRTVGFNQFQPYLGLNYNLGKGFKLNGMLSQRWRDGSEDVPGFWYEKNLGVSHEDYGGVRVGHMTTRAWAMTDYPYVSPFGLSDSFASTGAAYGMLTNAIRYTSPVFDVAQGDLVVEFTHDSGKAGFNVHKPRFSEVWVHYGKGDLVLDAMFQDSKNGGPVAWGHAPFTGVAYDAKHDALNGGSSQGVAMLMGRYKWTSQLEFTAAGRRNQWSGAYAVIIDPVGSQWNNMFNVNWGGYLNGVANPGYAASSNDWMLGASYKFGKWTAATGMVHLGKAKTNNPMDRGQTNSALVNTARLGYDLGRGFQAYGQAGMVHFNKQGLAPLSMPAHDAIKQIDSRITNAGNWFGVGLLFVF